jgi:hypothetical protein
MIIVPETARVQLRQALLRHRQSYELSEADYVKKVLKIALNTYKKCIETTDVEPLHLKRHTLIGLMKVAKLTPETLGIDVLMPTVSDQYGGYEPSEFKDLVGQYFVHRRSFLTAKNFVRGVLEIRIDDEKRCLAFEEYHNYIADSGLRDSFSYTGEIYINAPRTLFSMVAVRDGQVRLLMTQRPEQISRGISGISPQQRGATRMRGALLTHGFARNFWQAAVSAVALESLPPSMWRHARDLCRTIKPDDAEFAAIALEIAYAEEHATTMTPLMFTKVHAEKMGV